MAFVVTKRSDSPLPQIGTWITLSDETVNTQIKTLDYDVDIKFGSMAFIHAVRIEYIARVVTAGDRPIRFFIEDSAGDTIRQLDLAAPALNATAGPVSVTTTYEVAHGLAPDAPGIEYDTLPEAWVLLPGQVFRMHALVNVDVNDDVTNHVLIQVL